MPAAVRTLLGFLLITGGMFAGVLAAAGLAHAGGQCLFQGDWNCYGPPQWNGQMQPTWELLPYTWPNNRLQCNPITNRCYPGAGGN